MGVMCWPMPFWREEDNTLNMLLPLMSVFTLYLLVLAIYHDILKDDPVRATKSLAWAIVLILLYHVVGGKAPF